LIQNAETFFDAKQIRNMMTGGSSGSD